ncbi:hypothetical protein RLIN73S_06751 [Rhodanobacter lindaniclasticus]
MPSWNVPVTWKLRMRGMPPIGVARNSCTAMVTRSPTPTPSCIARSRPSTMFQLPGRRSASVPSSMCSPMSTTFGSCAGSMPRTRTPAERWPISMASDSTNGAAPSTCGLACAICRARGTSLIGPSTLVIVACDTAPRMRERIW